MSKQQADPELKAIRQVRDVLDKLPAPSKKRVLDYVVARANDPPEPQPQPALPGI